MPDDKPLNRRRFFRYGLGELLKPLLRAVEPVERVAQQLGEMEKIKPAQAVPYRKQADDGAGK